MPKHTTPLKRVFYTLKKGYSGDDIGELVDGNSDAKEVLVRVHDLLSNEPIFMWMDREGWNDLEARRAVLEERDIEVLLGVLS